MTGVAACVLGLCGPTAKPARALMTRVDVHGLAAVATQPAVDVTGIVRDALSGQPIAGVR